METLHYKNRYEQLKNEIIYLCIIFVVFLIAFKIIFNKEDIAVVLRTALSIFYLFVIPGFSLMWIWADKLDFLERLIIGVGLSAAVLTVVGYNLRIIGMQPKIQVFLLPPLFVIAGLLVIIKRGEFH